MAFIDLTVSEALQFAGLAAAIYLLMWWVIRPFSFVYRLDDGRISVRTFFLLPMATVKLSEISQVEVSQPAGEKPVRWLVSPYRRWSRQTVFAETNREWIVLPDGFAEELAARSSEISTDEERTAQLRGDSNYQHFLAVLMALNLAMRKLASWCVPLASAAAWCMILFPLWLTAVELIALKLFAAEVHISWTSVFDKSTWAHFAASTFLILCGITTRGLVAFGMQLPLSLAVISVFAAISSLSLGFPGAHDIISHPLFDSCEGYDERHSLIGTTCLAAAIVLTLASVGMKWNTKSIR